MIRRSLTTAAPGCVLCLLVLAAPLSAEEPAAAYDEQLSTEPGELAIDEDEPEDVEELPIEELPSDEAAIGESTELPVGDGASAEPAESPVPSGADAAAQPEQPSAVPPDVGSSVPLEPGSPSLVTRGPKKQVYGWIEDVLIDPVHTLKLPAKLDTGADTTSLDARNIRRSRRDGEDYVRFIVTEPQTGQSVELEKPFVRAVRIKGHGNEGARRVVVRMRICIGDRSRSVEVNLVDRAHYEFPLLLGRNALRDVAVIDPNLRRTREPSCWDADSLAAAPVSDNNEPAGGAPASCENAPMC